jgi:transglutaminase-like putative cysteine protease
MDSEDENARWWDLPAAALLMVAMLTVATRLVVTGWTDYLTLTQTIATLGAAAGLALGQSRFSPRLAFLFGLTYGLFVIPWQLGITIERNLPWLERMQLLQNRLTVIFGQLARREVVQDSLLFLVLMGLLFWLISVYAGYTLTRYGNAWRAMIPAGLVLFVLHSFDPLVPRRAWYLAVYLFFALVLVARLAFLQAHTRWQTSRTALPPHLGLDFIRYGLLAAGLIVIFSWTVPALANAVPAVVQAASPVREAYYNLRERFDVAFASLRSTVGVVSDYYGSTVLLGRGNRLTDDVVFRITPPADTPGGLRYYWRARTYDTYRDGQWLSSVATPQTFRPGDQPPKLSEYQGRYIGTYDVMAMTYMSTVFGPSQPLWLSRPAQIDAARNPDNTLDLTAIRANPSLNPGQSYKIESSIPSNTQAQLRRTGTDYPAWINQRYLQLPPTITPRTRELARTITAGLDNPYDKAAAITDWLRTNIVYQEIIPARPANQESVDWFLFDLKKGFCNYYATSEVVLLRSLGIPARWSVGYAQGELDQNGVFVVRQREAHAWPEVFFPGYGWIEFEPTAAQPVIDRAIGEDSAGVNVIAPTPDPGDNSNNQDLQAQQRLGANTTNPGGLAGFIQAAAPFAVTGSIVALAGGLLFFLYRRKELVMATVDRAPVTIERAILRVGLHPPEFLARWARRVSLPPLSRSYLEINGALNRLGSKPAITATPAERATELGRIAPTTREPADTLVREYQTGLFSPRPGDVTAAIAAGREVRRRSYRALFDRIRERIRKIL